ncbi:hypothetical protein L2D01_10980 [Hyphomonadaceae bacterium ML37]|nr:hypothetical protein L2D01_10980 [Hyphomonadaceae bacterium ML37]
MKALLACGIAAAALASAPAAMAETGTTDVQLTLLYAVMQNASPAPQYDAYCQSRFQSYLGTETSTQWNINPQSLIMWADTTVFGATASLTPMGLYGTYAFISGQLPPALTERNVDRVVFVLNESFEDPEVDLLLTFGAPFNCVLSNKPLHQDS